MRRALAAIVLVAGCSTDEPDRSLFDPAAPGAAGQLSLAAGVATTGYALVAMRMTPNGNDRERAQDMAMPDAWPAQFMVGGGLGGSQVSDWTLRIWLAVASNEPAPGSGAPQAEAMIGTACHAGSCQVAPVDLVLAP